MELIIIFLLVILIVAVVLLALKQRSGESESIRRIREESVAALARQEAASRSELNAIREQYNRQIRVLKEEMSAQAALLAETSRIQFENLSNASLSAQQNRLREESRREIETILSPLREKLAEFSKAVTEAYMNDNASRRSLSEQIDRLIRLNNTIGEETRSLTSALKGDSKVQGDWGEMILETLLESAGMKRDVTFFVQPTRDGEGKTIIDDEGSRRRPDILVKLPDDHSMIIDSKVSLTAYIRMTESSNPEEEARAAREHVRSVRKHVDELGSKQYHKYWPNAADHVLMFIPNEGAYFAVLHHDPELWKYAYDKNVVIVSPTHVFSVMQIISQLWRQENQNRNAARIAELGGKLYDRFAKFNDQMMKIRSKIDETNRTFDEAYSTFAGSTQSLTRTAERLRELGAKTSRHLPPSSIN